MAEKTFVIIFKQSELYFTTSFTNLRNKETRPPGLNPIKIFVCVNFMLWSN